MPSLPSSSSFSSLHRGEEPRDFPLELGKLHSEDALPRMQDQVKRRRQLVQVPSNRGPHTTANPVPLHSAAQNFSDSETHARSPGTAALMIKSDHVARKMLPALLVDRLKVGMLQ
jgi:hypothetical protein